LGFDTGDWTAKNFENKVNYYDGDQPWKDYESTFGGSRED